MYVTVRVVVPTLMIKSSPAEPPTTSAAAEKPTEAMRWGTVPATVTVWAPGLARGVLVTVRMEVSLEVAVRA